MLRVDRTSPEFAATEDPTCYTKPQLQRLLATLNAGELRQRVTDGSRAAGVWGCCFPASGHPLACTLRTLRSSPFLSILPSCPPRPCAGNQRHGGLQLVCEAHAIIGCVQFLEVGAAAVASQQGDVCRYAPCLPRFQELAC